MDAKILLCFAFLAIWGHVHSLPQRGDERDGGARGAELWKKLMIFNPDFVMTTPTIPGPHVPKKRKSRGEQWMMKFRVNAHLDLTTTTTTKKPTTTTRSPEQVAEEKRKHQERSDPKNFFKKLKQLNLLDDKATKETEVDKEVKNMDKKLHSMLQGCMENKDCGNSTCCYKEDAAKPGKCIVPPHRLDQQCSDLCACQGKFDGVELECKVMEVAVTSDESGSIKDSRQCKQRELTEKEFMQKVLQKMREGKGKSPRKPIRTHRTQRDKRVMFT